MMYEVYDVNTKEVIHRSRSHAHALQYVRDMNKANMDRLYAVRNSGR